MNGLCHSINIDEECIQQRWLKLLWATQNRETIEQEIGQRTRNQENETVAPSTGATCTDTKTNSQDTGEPTEGGAAHEPPRQKIGKNEPAP